MRWITTAILWTPRLLAMALAFFLAMFAMDVYLEGNDFWKTSEAFVLHLIPALCVIVILAIGWRRDGLSSIGFLILSIAYFIASSGWKSFPASLVLVLPPLGISLAFYARMRLLLHQRTASE
jgi:hypothetical protein